MAGTRQAPPGYAANFPERASACKRAAGYRCQHCGAAHRTLAISKTGERYMKYVNACHVNHDPDNPEAELICLCLACHAAFDARQHAETRRKATEGNGERNSASVGTFFPTLT